MSPENDAGREPTEDVEAVLAAAGLARAFADYAERHHVRPGELRHALSAWLTELIDEAERPDPEEPET
ncbi:hypothetical protein E1262_25050 [Jiangella aurantiaca]|uniref:Uncharacterized protein n=1 Tax=Jiangella aurantiaca TaxID=2530373 RepID=A0A4R5A780_9ACTN|nr:hypothetical protein [Jiangella aurantiaca]TDD65452.1 hypothetical protein E1262_25050 [Jiangella aurantiaca]